MCFSIWHNNNLPIVNIVTCRYSSRPRCTSTTTLYKLRGTGPSPQYLHVFEQVSKILSLTILLPSLHPSHLVFLPNLVLFFNGHYENYTLNQHTNVHFRNCDQLQFFLIMFSISLKFEQTCQTFQL